MRAYTFSQVPWGKVLIKEDIFTVDDSQLLLKLRTGKFQDEVKAFCEELKQKTGYIRHASLHHSVQTKLFNKDGTILWSGEPPYKGVHHADKYESTLFDLLNNSTDVEVIFRPEVVYNRLRLVVLYAKLHDGLFEEDDSPAKSSLDSMITIR